jgi:VCBS repeat-containing protein
VNDAPVAVNEVYTTTEDKVLTVAASGVLKNDTDVEGNSLTAVLVSGPAHGTLTLTTQGGFTYTPAPDYNGTDSFTYKANDGILNSNVATVALTITPVNDAPVNTVPGAQTMAEDGVLVFSSSNGNRISVSDVDAGSSPVQVTLSATHGVLTLGGTAGLVFTAGDGTADGAMTFTGTLATVNAALNGLWFKPSKNFTGGANIKLTTNDLGNAGAGGSKNDTDTVTITVLTVNNAAVVLNDSVSTLQPASLVAETAGEQNTRFANDSPAVLKSLTGSALNDTYTLVFDELRGELVRSGLSHSLGQTSKLDLSSGGRFGSSQGNNGGDWIIDLKKLH